MAKKVKRYPKVEMKNCARCGEQFEQKPHTGRKYCDGACAQIVKAEANAVRHAARYKKKPAETRAFDCRNCGKECTTNHPTKVYCTNRCTRIHELQMRRESRRAVIVDHDDGCHCGGCLGVESRRK